VYGGRADVYKNLSSESLEKVSTPDAIRAVTNPNVAPTRVWKVLEHGEKVECLSCIPDVSELLYNGNAKTREISAWWLRRRIFGVFGPGEVYSKVVDTLNDASQPAEHRAYAAEALGEFLSGSGVKHVAKAAVGDPDAGVRLSAVKALRRLNNQGPDGELATAINDDAESVRLAAIEAAMGVNAFSGLDAVVGRVSDSSALVRRRAAEALGMMRAGDAVVGLMALTSPTNEADAAVRAAAVYALGQIADPEAKPAVQAASDDADGFVRDAARIALRRL
jgi:HEAT repeat protein